MSNLLRFAVLGIALLATPSRSEAATLPFAGELSIDARLPSETPQFALSGFGGFEANPGGGLHLTQGVVPGGAVAGSRVVQPVTDPQIFPIAGFQMTASNATGGFVEQPGGALGGTMPLHGVWKVCL
jgi:hypothetical protein